MSCFEKGILKHGATYLLQMPSASLGDSKYPFQNLWDRDAVLYGVCMTEVPSEQQSVRLCYQWWVEAFLALGRFALLNSSLELSPGILSFLGSSFK